MTDETGMFTASFSIFVCLALNAFGQHGNSLESCCMGSTHDIQMRYSFFSNALYLNGFFNTYSFWLPVGT